MLTWMITVLAVTAYCVVRAILDLLRKRYVCPLWDSYAARLYYSLPSTRTP